MLVGEKRFENSDICSINRLKKLVDSIDRKKLKNKNHKL